MNSIALMTLSIALMIDTAGAGWVGHADPVTATSDSPVLEEAPVEGSVDPYGFYGTDLEERGEIIDAMAAFTEQGLVLPELRIYVHDSDAGCNGNLGLFGSGGDKRRIDICMFDPSLIRHELAHAWEYHQMVDATRSAFMDQAGIESWNDRDAGHHARGIEQAAYLIAWGLDRQPIQRLSGTHFAQDLALFELLVGFPSPRIAHWDDQRPVSSPRPIVRGLTPDSALT